MARQQRTYSGVYALAQLIITGKSTIYFRYA